jgi:hypothetical protein
MISRGSLEPQPGGWAAARTQAARGAAREPRRWGALFMERIAYWDSRDQRQKNEFLAPEFDVLSTRCFE